MLTDFDKERLRFVIPDLQRENENFGYDGHDAGSLKYDK